MKNMTVKKYTDLNWPVYNEQIKKLDSADNVRSFYLLRGLRLIAKSIPNGTQFRLCFAGDLLRSKAWRKAGKIDPDNQYKVFKKRYSNINLLAELMMVNGAYISPFQKTENQITQI